MKAGQGVELQWKMQQGSPFGWWFGIVESLERDKAGRARRGGVGGVRGGGGGEGSASGGKGTQRFWEPCVFQAQQGQAKAF